MVGHTHAHGLLAALLAALALAGSLGSLVSLVSLGSSAAHAQPASPRAESTGSTDWRDPGSWQRLRLGMSRFDVLRILGEPGKVTRYYAFERWEYPDALGRRVNFDERGRLIAWGPYAR